MVDTVQGALPAARTPARALPRERAQLLYRLAVGAAITLGFLIRAVYIVTEDFPLNDGGFFYALVRDLQQAHYRLPATTSYNAAGIPFTYPPLGFYLAGLLDDLTPFSLLDIFRFLPLAATTLTIVAVFLLARAMLASDFAVVVATFAFALTPRSFIWLLMGGGVARALGLLFAVLGLWQVYLLYTRRQARHILPAGICAACTVLSHLETGQFLAFSAALFFLAYGRHWRGVAYSALVAAATVALTAPWWGTVLAQHGLAPLLAARDTGPSIFTDPGARGTALYVLARLGETGEPFFPFPRMLALLGALAVLAEAVAAAARRRFVFPLLPAWWAATILLDLRAYATYITVPMALLTGVGIATILYPALRRLPGSLPPLATVPCDSDAGPAPGWADRGRIWAAVVLAFFLCYGIGSALAPKRPQAGGEAGVLISLAPEERETMAWIARETPPGSRFLVIGGGPWTIDRALEWFPVLTGRVSVTTVQGTEWLPNHAFADREMLDGMAQECAGQDSSCIERFAADTGVPFDHVYVRLPTPGSRHPANQCCQVAASLAADPRYTLLYAGPRTMVFARR